MTDAPDHQSAGAARTSHRHARVFLDQDGTSWRVHEQPFSDYDRRRGLSLIFASEGAVRRVRVYPADWYDLSDEELAALSWTV